MPLCPRSSTEYCSGNFRQCVETWRKQLDVREDRSSCGIVLFVLGSKVGWGAVSSTHSTRSSWCYPHPSFRRETYTCYSKRGRHVGSSNRGRLEISRYTHSYINPLLFIVQWGRKTNPQLHGGELSTEFTDQACTPAIHQPVANAIDALFDRCRVLKST